MIFVEGCGVVDMGKNGELPKQFKKEAWTDGEKFRMIFVKESKEVRKRNEKTGCN